MPKRAVFLLISLFIAGLSLPAHAASGGGGGGASLNTVSLEPLVVNLAPPNLDRFLQVAMTFEAEDAKTAELLKTYTPVLRSRAIFVLTSKTKPELMTVEGKMSLMNELLDMARVSIPASSKEPSKGILDVHFTNFLVQ